MPVIWPLRLSISFCLIFLLAAASPCLAQPGSTPPAKLEQLPAAGLSPEILPRVLAEGATTLEGQIKALESRLAESQQRLAERQNDLKNLQVAVASLKAALAVGKPSCDSSPGIVSLL